MRRRELGSCRKTWRPLASSPPREWSARRVQLRLLFPSRTSPAEGNRACSYSTPKQAQEQRLPRVFLHLVSVMRKVCRYYDRRGRRAVSEPPSPLPVGRPTANIGAIGLPASHARRHRRVLVAVTQERDKRPRPAPDIETPKSFMGNR